MPTAPMPAAPTRYNRVAMSLHWLMAALILGLAAVGFIMVDMDNTTPLKFTLYQLHKSFGFSILVLSFGRLLWRLTHTRPPLPTPSKGWERRLAQLIHLTFYLLMLGLPLVGWLGVSASPLKIPTVIFGLFTLPALPFFQNQPDAAGQLFELHQALACILLSLLVLHVAAALKNHFILRNDVLLRMLPQRLAPCLLALRGKPHG
jgi:cytochrome b561